MTAPTFLYARIYTKYGKVKVIYTGITYNMLRRQQEHDKGFTISTNRYNKKYGLPYEIWYGKFADKERAGLLERRFKKYSQKKKLKFIKEYLWTKWAR